MLKHSSDALAAGLTDIHSEKFQTPRLVVNVTFSDFTKPSYIAGKRRKSNLLVAVVRAGPGRTPEMWDDTCSEINALWTSIVGNQGEKELRGIFILGSLIAGTEAGFPIPQAGQDKMWAKQHMPAMKKKAAEGDEDFKEFLEEMKNRPGWGELITNGV